MEDISHLYGRLHEELRRARRVLLVAHRKPDGDAMGSSASVLAWLLSEGKDVTAFCVDLPGPNFRFLRHSEKYTSDPAVFSQAYDLVCVFDSGDLRYCGIHDLVGNLAPGYTLVNLDHHATNAHYGQLNLVMTQASSTCEVVHRFFMHNGITPDPDMATALLTGLTTDTFNFRNAASNSYSLEAASALLSNGARQMDIIKNINFDKSIDGLRLWGLMLSRLHYNSELDITSTYLLAQESDTASTEAIDGAANFLNNVVAGSDTIMVLRELPGGLIKGSFRSLNRDVSKLAKLFGGGGHKKAAGFTVKGKISVTPNGPEIIATE